MKKLIIAFLVLTPVLLFINCQNAEHQSEEALKKEIFVIHDDVMPKTSEINRLQRKLRGIKKENTSLDSMQQQKLTALLKQLEEAHDGMMVWMNNFKSPAKLRASKSHQEIMEYLNEEKSKIEKVRDDMLMSIDAGDTMLNDLKKK